MIIITKPSLITRSRPARPPAYILEIAHLPCGLGKELSSWEWSPVKAVFDYANEALKRERIPEKFWFTDERSMLEAYALLNRKDGPNGLYTWVSNDSGACETKVLPDTLPENMHIPSGWVEPITWAIDNGVTMVIPRGQKIGNGTHYDLDGKLWNGTVRWLHHRGGNKYELADVHHHT
jgi:hypothetical protein